MKPEENLDTILTYLYNEYEKESLQYVSSKSICQLGDLKVNSAEAYMILLKLNSDNFVNISDSNRWSFQINYDGILFIRSGGYEQKSKDLKRKRIKEDIFNVMIAVGTSLAGLYALWQFWIEFSKNLF